MTASIVEIINQFPFKRILAVAPSDAAADVIVTRLAKAKSYTSKEMLRLNWWQRTIASVL